MTERPSVSIRLGGSTYHVQSSASPQEVQRLADLVDDKLRALTPGGRPASPQTFLLVAMAFAHEVADERQRRQAAESELRDLRRHFASSAAVAEPALARSAEPPVSRSAEAARPGSAPATSRSPRRGR